jgi:hypothetical protein
VFDACRGPLSRHKGGATGVSYSSRDIQQIGARGGENSPAVIVCSCHPSQLAYEESGVEGGVFTAAMLAVFHDQREQGIKVGFTPNFSERIETQLNCIWNQSATPIPQSSRPTP